MAAGVATMGERRSNVLPAHPINLDPIIPVIGKVLTGVELIRPFKTAVDCLDSSAFMNVSMVSLKSLPYALSGKNKIVREFDNGLSCRLRYLEAALISTASLVYNFALGSLFSVASLVTGGQLKMIVAQMRKHWIHTALAVGAIGISSIGTFAPDLGVKANGAFIFAVGVAILQWMQGDVIGKLCNAYQTHRQELKDAVLQGLQGDRDFFDREFAPLFNHLDTHLNQGIHSFSDLANACQGVPLPRVAPMVNKEGMMNAMQDLFADGESIGQTIPHEVEGSASAE